MKPFFWNKLGNTSVELTVWNDLTSGGSSMDLDLKDLEETFIVDDGLKPLNGAAGVAGSKFGASQIKKANVTTMLDITRANNVGEWIFIPR